MILNRLMKKGFRKVLKISKISAIVSLIAVFGFSNFISFLPQVWQNNELAESLKIKEAQAAVNTEVVDLYRGDSYDTNLSTNYKIMGASLDTVIYTQKGGNDSSVICQINIVNL